MAASRGNFSLCKAIQRTASFFQVTERKGALQRLVWSCCQPSKFAFTRESWLFTHQITSCGAWTFLPLALRLTMHSARFELTLALRQEVPKPSCFQVTPDLFHWQGHLLDGVRVTLSFGIGCQSRVSMCSSHLATANF